MNENLIIPLIKCISISTFDSFILVISFLKAVNNMLCISDTVLPS